MSTDPETDPDPDDRPLDENMLALAIAAHRAKPRLFTMYGGYTSGTPLIGWGLDFPTFGVLFHEPHINRTQVSASVEELLVLYAKVSEAYLDWLS